MTLLKTVMEGYIFRLMLQFQDLLFRSGVLLPIVREIVSELTDVVEFWCCDITKSGLLCVEHIRDVSTMDRTTGRDGRYKKKSILHSYYTTRL